MFASSFQVVTCSLLCCACPKLIAHTLAEQTYVYIHSHSHADHAHILALFNGHVHISNDACFLINPFYVQRFPKILF